MTSTRNSSSRESLARSVVFVADAGHDIAARMRRMLISHFFSANVRFRSLAQLDDNADFFKGSIHFSVSLANSATGLLWLSRTTVARVSEVFREFSQNNARRVRLQGYILIQKQLNGTTEKRCFVA